MVAAQNVAAERSNIASHLDEHSFSSAASVYMHVPFCVHKCHYCDFYSIVDNRNRQSAFTARLIREIESSTRYLSVPIRTIFVGGGTPTLLEPALWQTLGKTMREHLPLAADAEFTVEANPETVTAELADVLVSVGVNRVSIGAQSFNAAHLKTLERQHDPANVQRSIERFRAAGITNCNIDLIFGVPGQTLDEWLDDLQRVLELQPAHMSCYGLTYEPNTPMTAKLRAGQIARIDESLEAQMYEATMERLADAGFEQYEVSNWALPGARCQHNMAYWTNENWWALGPSASGHMNGVRWKNVPRLGEYLETDSSNGRPPVMDVEKLDRDGQVGEELMLRLRLMDGVPIARLDALLDDAPRNVQRRDAIEAHIAAGHLERTNDALRLTPRGLMVADSVLADLI